MTTQATADVGATSLGRGGRMSRQRKRDAVLRLLRGEGLELESERLKAKLGEMLLGRELLEAKVAALEGSRPSLRRRSRR